MSSINNNTPVKKVWKRINKIREKYVQSPIPCLQDHGNMVIDSQNVANKMADHYYTVSSNDGYGQLFMPTKAREENKPLNFASHENEEYNASISMKEISSALSQRRNTAPDLDGIFLIQHLSFCF